MWRGGGLRDVCQGYTRWLRTTCGDWFSLSPIWALGWWQESHLLSHLTAGRWSLSEEYGMTDFQAWLKEQRAHV